MIKILITSIFLLMASSCSVTSYSELAPLIKTAVVGTPDIEVSDEYINNKQYSFARMRLGRASTAILILSRIENNVFVWVSGDSEKIYTFNGRVIKTEGLVHNFESYDYHLFNPKPLSHSGLSSYQIDLFFKNPDAFVSQDIVLNINKSSDDILHIFESIKTNGFKWNVTNEYSLNNVTGLPIKAVQFIHPHLPKIEIDYYFK